MGGKGSLRRRDGAFGGLLVVLLTSAIYLSTLAPTVLTYRTGGYDATFLQAKAYTLGIGHPTGYPTFILMGKLFTYLPVGDVAYRMNLFCAVCGILAVLFTYLIALRLSRGRVIPAAAAALAFAVSQTFWSQTIITEVYSLNALLVSATVYTFLLWREKRDDRYIVLGAFLTGLAMTNHMTSGLLIPAVLLFVSLVDWRRLAEVKLTIKAALAFFVGLLPYLYLPIRAAMDPPLSGFMDEPTLERFVFMVTGGPWKGHMSVSGAWEDPGRFMLYLDLLTEQFPLLLLVASALGAGVLLFRDRAALAFLMVLFMGYLLYSLGYDIVDVEAYFIPTYLVLALFTAAAFGLYVEAIGAWFERPGGEVWGRIATGAAGVLVLLVALGNLPHTFRDVDLSEHYEGRLILDTLAADLPPDAKIMNWRDFGIIHYARLVDPGHEEMEYVRVRRDELTETAGSALRDSATYFLNPGQGDRAELERAGYRLAPIVEENTGPSIYEVHPPKGSSR